jgi:integral membrane protein
VSTPAREKTAPRPVTWRLPLYRAFAWITGVALILLVFYAVPMKYLADDGGPVAVLGVTHGYLYMAYIVVTLLLAERARFSPKFALLVLLAGTIPICSFIAERKVTHRVQAQEASPASSSETSST